MLAVDIVKFVIVDRPTLLNVLFKTLDGIFVQSWSKCEIM